jgi:hypothetical protein
MTNVPCRGHVRHVMSGTWGESDDAAGIASGAAESTFKQKQVLKARSELPNGQRDPPFG